MRGGWIAVALTLVMIASVSAWEYWREMDADARKASSRDYACLRALDETATRHEAHAKELDEFAVTEPELRKRIDGERAAAVRAIEALSMRGDKEDLLAPLRRGLDGRPGIERIEVNRRADDQRTVGWQEYAIRLRGGWEAVTEAIDAVHELEVVVRVERLELRLDRTRRRATLDARVTAAVWSDPQLIERAHPELARNIQGVIPTACSPLDLCRASEPDAARLDRWQKACTQIDARAPIEERFRRVESLEDDVERLSLLAGEISDVRDASRKALETKGGELLKRALASKRGYAGIDLAAEDGPVWLD